LHTELGVDPARHRARPWRVHGLASDFMLRDVWRVPVIAAGGDRFEDFYRLVAENGIATDGAVANALFALRERLGRWFRWDDHKHELPIPGCTERSVRERLTTEDLARDRSAEVALPHQRLADFRPVYLFADESLSEISNSTIHALAHFGWVDDGAGKKTAEMAVYTKSRGLLSDVYMGAIKPFRHRFVYRALIRRLVRLWNERPRPEQAATSGS